MRLVFGLYGFVVVAGLLFLLEALIAMGLQMRPVGLGWLALPVLTGITFARIFTLVPEMLESMKPQLGRALLAPVHQTLNVLAVVGWTVGFLAYWFTAQPYGFDLSDHELMGFLELLLLPPLGFLFLYITCLWVTRESPPKQF